jgi:putative oxidoreductase
MLGAILFVHLPAGLFLPNGYEFALSLLGAVTFLASAGAGSYSLDEIIERRRRLA